MNAAADRRQAAAMPAPAPPEFGSMVDLLRSRAAGQPTERAYVFLTERDGEAARLTFGALGDRAEAFALRLAARAPPGERALLLFPPGLDFIVALFGCLIAGVVAVPIMLPRRRTTRDASASILADCTPRLALTTRAVIADARPDIVARFRDAGIEWLAVDAGRDQGAPSARAPAAPQPADIAFLQYTSGSTAAPKGVVVSHGNLLANLEMIKRAFGNTRASTYVSWVPLYHDMGLIVNVLQSLYVGALCALMPPVFFVQRPLAWLRAISDYRAEVAGGPNFAFDLCVDRYDAEQMAGVDLSRWKLAFNGAEPVRAETIERFAATFRPHGFAADAMYPAYGMAEATVLISAGRRGAGPVTRRVSRAALRRHAALPPRGAADAQRTVGCGAALPGGRIAIVDPATRQRREPWQVGEIWAAGPNIAQGYWRNATATTAAFAARIEGEDEIFWLRTGDLGFCDADGELYITGRIKDVIIIRGINHHPQDIEETVQKVDPALRRHGGAAFSVAEGDAAERLVIIQEIERAARHQLPRDDLLGRIREAIARDHELAAYRILLIRPGTLPKTTSGKIQRDAARRLWLQGALEAL